MTNKSSLNWFWISLALIAPVVVLLTISDLKKEGVRRVPPIGTFPPGKGIQKPSGYENWVMYSSGADRGRQLEVKPRKDTVIHIACPSETEDEGFLLRIPEGIQYELSSDGHAIIFSRAGQDRYLLLANTRFNDQQTFEWELSIAGFESRNPDTVIQLTASQQKPLASEYIQQQLDAFSEQSSRKE